MEKDTKNKKLVFTVTIKGDPIAHERPRLSRFGHAYTPTATRKFRELVMWGIKSVYRKPTDEESRFCVDLKFYRSDRRRIDLDNLSKSIMDAVTTVRVWKDDSQVQELHAVKFLACSEPRTEVTVYTLEDNSPRVKCPTCSKPVKNAYRSNGVRFCSQDCFSKFTRMTKTCGFCGKEFTIPKSREKYAVNFCSRKCTVSFRGAQKTATSGPHLWRCLMCGGPVSRKEYAFCKNCHVLQKEPKGSSNYYSGIKPA